MLLCPSASSSAHNFGSAGAAARAIGTHIVAIRLRLTSVANVYWRFCLVMGMQPQPTRQPSALTLGILVR